MHTTTVRRRRRAGALFGVLLALVMSALFAARATPALASTSTTQPAVVMNSSGAFAAFMLDSSGNLVTSHQSTSGGSWSSWASLGGSSLSDSGTLAGSPAVYQNSSGANMAFAISTAGNLWMIYQSTAGGSWSSWTNLGDTNLAGASPYVMMDSSGYLEVFAVSSSRNYVENEEQYGTVGWPGTWSGAFLDLPQLTTDSFTGVPAVVVNSSGDNVVFDIGSSGKLWEAVQSSPGSGYNNWVSLGGSSLSDGGTLAGSPAVYQNSSGAEMAFAISTAGNIWRTYQSTSGGSWSSLSNLGDANLGGASPSAIKDSTGCIEVFAVSSSRNYVENEEQYGNWPPCSAWPGNWAGGFLDLPTLTTDTFTGTPTALVNSSGDNVVFDVGSSGDLLEAVQVSPGSGYHNWVDLGS